MPDASVLIVEDELLIAEDLRRTVQRLGYTVVGVVDDGDDAMRAAETLLPSLVLMDIKLRGSTDGIEAARVIGDRVGAPVVMLTSHADAATVSRASAVRPAGYVLKPFAERDLRVAIELALHKAEIDKALRSQAAQHASILGAVSDGIVAVDADLVVVYGNPAADRMLAASGGVARGRAMAEVLAAALPCATEARATRCAVLTSEPVQIELADGIRTVTCAAAPILDDVGVLTGVAIVARDITRETDLLLQLARAERFSALTTLAGGIGHEINNPLMVVMASLDGLRETPGDTLLIDDAELAADRIAGIVRTMRDFVRGSARDTGPVDLGEAFHQVERLARPALDAGIELSMALSESLIVHGRSVELGQVLLNLVLNAAEACDPTIRDHRIEVLAARDDTGDVVITIRDTGRGMPPEILGRIFEPFFTTRGPGRGTGSGLGLAIVRQIVHMFGGTIDVSSVVDVGTTFTIRLRPG